MEGSVRPIKRLEASVRSGKKIKEYFFEVQRRAREGEDFAMFAPMVPMEIFRAMDIPYVFTHWWTAICNAKRDGVRLQQYIADAGYRNDICSYCTTCLGCALDPTPELEPWGGLPKPTIFIVGSNQDCGIKQDQIMADAFGAKTCSLLLSKQRNTPDCWWELQEDNWEELVGKERLDHYERQVRKLASFLCEVTGRTLDKSKLIHVLHNVNEQEHYNKKIRDIIAQSRLSPATINDTMNAIQQAQWLRGTDWAVEHSRLFYEEIKDKAENNKPAVPNEKIRLMWLGVGLWVDTEWYQMFEQKYGASFIWSIYNGVGAECYTRHLVEENPFRCLAARIAILEDFLHNSKFCNQFYVREAVNSRIDGVVYCIRKNCPNDNRDFHYSVINELERHGIAVCRLDVDPGDAKTWNKDTMTKMVEDMIETRILPRKNA